MKGSRIFRLPQGFYGDPALQMAVLVIGSVAVYACQHVSHLVIFPAISNLLRIVAEIEVQSTIVPRKFFERAALV